jgi:nitroreductase
MEFLKSAIRKLFPNLFPSLHIIFGYIYDARKFIITNTNNNYRGKKNKHEAIIIRLCHGIEKAFSLPAPRLGYGKTTVLMLIQEVSIYYNKYGFNDLLRAALDSLLHYKEFHESNHVTNINEILSSIKSLVKSIKEYNETDAKIGCGKEFKRYDIHSIINNFDFIKFSESRHSIRDFDKGEISDEFIRKAVAISINSPSACNRQAWKVYVFKGEQKNMVLNFQNGNRGFQESINTVLLVTGLTSSFSDGERNQVFIDGGLFSMNLIFSFHSMGIGVCSLNTSYKWKQEKALRHAINLKIDEAPIMMLALGQLKPTFFVAGAPRKNVDEVLVFNP